MRRSRSTLPGLWAIALGALLMPASRPAEGGIIVTQTTVEEIADPTFLYTFTVEINDDCVLQPGNYFTIFDLFLPPGDFLALPDHPPTQPGGWIFSTPTTGPSPFPPSPLDTGIWNVSWMYAGPVVAGPFFVGTFTVTIVQDVPKLPEIVFVSECGPLGSSVPEMGTVRVQAIPEPATFWSLAGGVGLLAIGACRRRAGV
jgi:hypothetical protein